MREDGCAGPRNSEVTRTRREGPPFVLAPGRDSLLVVTSDPVYSVGVLKASKGQQLLDGDGIDGLVAYIADEHGRGGIHSVDGLDQGLKWNKGTRGAESGEKWCTRALELVVPRCCLKDT